MEITKKQMLEKTAREIRRNIVSTIAEVGQGHIGGSLSIVDIITLLYFDIMNIDPGKPDMENRDRFILSKGHAGPGLYATLAEKGYFPKEDLLTMNKPNTNLPSHCDMLLTRGVDMTAGSLGQGIGCAVGMAKAAKIKGSPEYVYAIIGDGESQEGTVWEASMIAAQLKLDNLIVFLDWNKMQLDGYVDDIVSLQDAAAKWESFGFNTFKVNGHDFDAMESAILEAKKLKNHKPTMIILDTIKGQGISFVVNAGISNHSMTVTKEQLAEALAELNKEGN